MPNMEKDSQQQPKESSAEQEVELRSHAESKTDEMSAAHAPEPKGSHLVYWKIALSVFGGIGGFITVSLLVWQGAEWIRKTIDESVATKLTDERVLRQIAEHVKPSLIFDTNEAIVEDMGATAFIADNGKGIHLSKEQDDWPRRIHIDFSRHFANPPILTSMHESTIIIPSRGKGFSWDFDVSDVIQHTSGMSNLWTYRLEVVP